MNGELESILSAVQSSSVRPSWPRHGNDFWRKAAKTSNKLEHFFWARVHSLVSSSGWKPCSLSLFLAYKNYDCAVQADCSSATIQTNSIQFSQWTLNKDVYISSVSFISDTDLQSPGCLGRTGTPVTHASNLTTARTGCLRWGHKTKVNTQRKHEFLGNVYNESRQSSLLGPSLKYTRSPNKIYLVPTKIYLVPH